MGYRDSKLYGLDEIRSWLASVDRYLAKPATLVLIGGAAAAFHKAESTTNDVDTIDTLEPELEHAISKAKQETGLALPIGPSPVVDVPWNAEDRYERVLPELAHLEVWVLEKHDLALSKAVRCNEHDLQQLEEIHRNAQLDLSVLVDRYNDEMGHVFGNDERIRQNLLDLVERLFGELKRVQADRATRRPS